MYLKCEGKSLLLFSFYNQTGLVKGCNELNILLWTGLCSFQSKNVMNVIIL